MPVSARTGELGSIAQAIADLLPGTVEEGRPQTPTSYVANPGEEVSAALVPTHKLCHGSLT